MNHNLVQVNDNYGVVIDEKGNVSLISKENCKYNFEHILIGENELEELNSKLNNLKRELSNNKSNSILE